MGSSSYFFNGTEYTIANGVFISKGTENQILKGVFSCSDGEILFNTESFWDKYNKNLSFNSWESLGNIDRDILKEEYEGNLDGDSPIGIEENWGGQSIPFTYNIDGIEYQDEAVFNGVVHRESEEGDQNYHLAFYTKYPFPKPVTLALGIGTFEYNSGEETRWKSVLYEVDFPDKNIDNVEDWKKCFPSEIQNVFRPTEKSTERYHRNVYTDEAYGDLHIGEWELNSKNYTQEGGLHPEQEYVSFNPTSLEIITPYDDIVYNRDGLPVSCWIRDWGSTIPSVLYLDENGEEAECTPDKGGYSYNSTEEHYFQLRFYVGGK